MTKNNEFIWKAIQTVCWLIFAGLCVQTGALLFNLLYSLFRPVATHNLHLGLDLSDLYSQSMTLYLLLFSLIIGLSFLKSVVFYQVITLFYKIRLQEPFTEAVSTVIGRISYYAFSVGLLSHIAHQFTKHLMHKGYAVASAGVYWNDSDAYLMMAAIVYVIALIFKKGIALQEENELTV